MSESSLRWARKAGPAVHDDLVRRALSSDAPNRLCLSDITEQLGREITLCLCAIKDVSSGRIVGCSIDYRMKSRLALVVLVDAVARRAHVAGCIVHGDRGSQFRPGRFVRALAHNQMAGSIGRVSAHPRQRCSAFEPSVRSRPCRPGATRPAVRYPRPH
ncbi:DDE-type integrase/transposase/recombinase [Streptomyces sp. NPDC059639]|uniref:DDE-type integrase/transposase/recombinase n=1 Tax=Streptomyces sp. NPDC059639 TaxID=3346891 RepID=UPI0036BEF1B2